MTLKVIEGKAIQPHFLVGDVSKGRTVEAGSFAANAFGLHDMHGNVAEWVQDCPAFPDGHAEAPRDGSAYAQSNCSSRIVRGGSWASPPEHVRSAARTADSPDRRSTTIGFRIARTLPLPR